MNIASTKHPASWIAACFISLAMPGLVAPAMAQATPATNGISSDTLKARLAEAQAREDFDPALKAQIVETYRSAEAALASATALRAETAQLRKTQASAPETMRRLERELRSMRADAAANRRDKIEDLPLDALERLASRTRENAAQARKRLAELQRRFDDLVALPLSARLEQAELQARADSSAANGGEPAAAGVPAPLAAAQRDLALANAAQIQARLSHVELEASAQPELARIAQLELALAHAQLDARAAEETRVRALLEQRQRSEIARIREQAARAAQAGNGRPDALAGMRARILERRVQLAEVSIAVDQALNRLGRRKEQLAEIEKTLSATRQRAGSATEGDELEKLLLGQISALPTPERFRAAQERRADALAQAADARLAVELELVKVADLDGAVASATAGLDPGLPASSREQIEQEVRTELGELERLLQRLDQELDILIQTLRAAEQAESAILRRAQDFRAELTHLLLWIPVSPFGLETFAETAHAVEWLLSAQSWHGVAETWRRAAQRGSAPLSGAALILFALLATRGWLKRRLPALAPGVIALHSFRLRHTFEALALSLCLAAPLPFTIWVAGRMLATARDAPLFAQSAGAALQLAGAIGLFFGVVRWLFDSGGVAVRHFGWHAQPVRTARRALQHLTALYVPLIFISVLATNQAPEPVRQSLGRIAFIAAMIAVAFFWRQAFHPARPLVRLDRDESTIGLRLIFAIVIRAPVWFGAGLALVSLFGFYFLAAYLHRFVLETIVLVFSAFMAYGLIALWLASQRVRLAEVEAQQASAAAQKESQAPSESPAVRLAEIDAAKIDAQTRQLLNLFITIVIGIGLWLVWTHAFDAMDFGTDLALWSYAETVNGKTVTRTISASGLLLAIAVGMVAYIGTRNIGGLLDIVLLQRLRLEADANYAIKTVARYATVGLGIVAAASLLGVSWSSVQWLIAALGVGLGFGLQEIVANFVSGLIVLGERPIRLGDVITVGDTSGTVSRIRARATVITDWENKEVMIPNKAFITERVTNWTLSNQVTRLLLKVGVAYGTDPARAEKVLMQVVRANPNVLVDPTPSVYFVEFGDSSLNFEIRAYVDATSKRLRTVHELNSAIAGALGEAGIEIPFPQRDLHIRSAQGLQGFSGQPAP